MDPRELRLAAVLTLLVVAGGAYYVFERPRVTEVPFRELRVEPGPEGLGLSPVAPEGFPDCRRSMLDLQIEDDRRHLDVTFRPKPGVQCGIPSVIDSWWVDATGKRFEPPAPKRLWDGRLLLMGRAGASDGGGLATACGMEPPISYFVELRGEAVEIGAIEDPECWGRRARMYPSVLYYRGGGLETPAGWLDASVEVQSRVSGDDIPFTLALTNDTEEAIVLSRCPFIAVRFVPDGSDAAAVKPFRTWLNCPAAPDAIEPGDALRFAIVAPHPQTAGIGTLELELRDENRVVQRVSSDVLEVLP